MTKEQIEELERLVAGDGVPAMTANHWRIPRLLEERKRLLEALRRSHDAMATWFSSEYTEHTTALNAKAALAFAEEAAR